MLAGIHGKEDGAIGCADPELLEDFLEQIEALKETFQQEMDEKIMKINMLNLGAYVLASGVVDGTGMVEAINAFQPTILVLAFCWTR